MADAVHFLTYDDEATPANASRCNGFPAPFSIGTPAAIYPISVAFTKIIKWFWRVKNWRLTTDLSVDGDVISGGAVTCSIIFGAARELDLVQPQSLVFQAASGVFLFNFEFFGEAGPTPGITFSAPNYKPSIQFTGDADTRVTFATNPTGLGTPDGTIVMLIDGEACNLYYFILFGGTVVTCTNFSLDPVLFWPYAAADTTPIYNTTTGAQLQDPRN